MSPRCRLEIEELGQRILPSNSPSLLPLSSLVPVLTAPQSHALAGQGAGTYVGGSLIVESAPGQGASATVELPLGE